MTLEINKLLMRIFTEFLNTASENLAAELIAPDAIFYIPWRIEPLRGPAGYLEILKMMQVGFPDIQWTMEDMINEGDKVAARFIIRGTHRGPFLGVSPTGKVVMVPAINFYRLSGAQIISEHSQLDMLGLLRQIGAVQKYTD